MEYAGLLIGLRGVRDALHDLSPPAQKIFIEGDCRHLAEDKNRSAGKTYRLHICYGTCGIHIHVGCSVAITTNGQVDPQLLSTLASSLISDCRWGFVTDRHGGVQRAEVLQHESSRWLNVKHNFPVLFIPRSLLPCSVKDAVIPWFARFRVQSLHVMHIFAFCLWAPSVWIGFCGLVSGGNEHIIGIPPIYLHSRAYTVYE